MSAWVREADIVITTALIPGKAPPLLVTADMVRALRPGSVVVDMAASNRGGNCACSVPDQVVLTKNRVKILGYTNLPSRSAATASAMFGNNVAKFILSVGPATNKECVGAFYPDIEADPAVRDMLVVDKGHVRWPITNPYAPPPVVVKIQTTTSTADTRVSKLIPTHGPVLSNAGTAAELPRHSAGQQLSTLDISDQDEDILSMSSSSLQAMSTSTNDALVTALGSKSLLSPRESSSSFSSFSSNAKLGALAVLALLLSGVASSDQQSSALISIFLLSSYAGQQAVYGVKPALHSPLMAVTNAISGLTAIGGIALLTSEHVGDTGDHVSNFVASINACVD